MCTKTRKLSDISCGWYINCKENFKIKAGNTEVRNFILSDFAAHKEHSYH